MEDKSFPCIIAEMDRLWSHQLILFSEPIKKAVPILESLSSDSSPTSVLSFTSLLNEETSIDESTSPQKQVLLKSASLPLQNDSSSNKEERKERMARMNVLGNRSHSNSSTPSTQHYHRKLRKANSTRRKLDKSMSCKTLGELELDEVKGFMDLGFIFKKENLSPRMMSVVPGLQRLGLHQKLLIDATETVPDNDNESEEEKRDIKRPYLSEAWVIKRPDSPLLSFKIPKPCSSTTMKKHLQGNAIKDSRGFNPTMIVLVVVVVVGLLLTFLIGNYVLYIYAQKTIPPRKKKLKRERLKQGVSAPGE